ncbi:MAG: DUF1566 domain-containing protein [Pseudomonadota bacterium]
MIFDNTNLRAAAVTTMLMLLVTSTAAASQRCELDVRLTTPTSRFTINAGVVLDTQSQRKWMRCPLGWSLDSRETDNTLDDVCVAGDSAIYDITTAVNEVSALNDAQGLTGDDAWRIANLEELQSITERACTQPAVNLSVFPARALSVTLAANISGRGYPFSYDFNDGTSNAFFSGVADGDLNGPTGTIWLVRR